MSGDSGQFSIPPFSSSAYWIPEGTLLEANQAALDFAGVTNDDVVGKPFWETTWWSTSAREQKRLKEAIQKASQGHLVRYETTNTGADGKIFSIDFSLKPVKNEHGETLLIIPEGRDITERKQAEEEVQRHQRESAHFMRLSLMGEMAAGMAHELNQPLAAMTSYCGTAHSILSELPSAPKDLVDMLDRVTEQAHRASEIINHIRRFVSKGGTNKGLVDIDKLIVEMSDFLEWELRNSKVNIDLELDAQGRKISANSVQIEQVLLNLIRNSLEAIQNARISNGRLTLETRLIAGNSIRNNCDRQWTWYRRGDAQAFIRALPDQQGKRNGNGPIDRPLDHTCPQWENMVK